MKPQEKIKKATAFFMILFAAFASKGQSSVNTIGNGENPQEKLFVQLKVTPQSRSFSANVNPTDSAMRLRVWVANPEEAKVNISIKSDNVGYYFSKRLSDAWYAQTFDFSNAEDGTYTIEIEKGKERFRKRILISTENYSVRKTNVY